VGHGENLRTKTERFSANRVASQKDGERPGRRVVGNLQNCIVHAGKPRLEGEEDKSGGRASIGGGKRNRSVPGKPTPKIWTRGEKRVLREIEVKGW